MALCSSGAMSLGGSTVGRSVNCELGCSGTASINMNRADVRDLADRPSGCIRMSDFYGKSSFVTPTAFGQCDATWGGIYMATVCTASSNYYVFVAPNATGCIRFCPWKTTISFTLGARSFFDGYANTYNAMTDSTHPAGFWCATRTIGGFSDWYLPALYELETVSDNGATGNNETVIGTGEAFRSSVYFSSTESSFTTPWSWSFFADVASDASSKTSGSNRTRAVRRVPI